MEESSHATFDRFFDNVLICRCGAVHVPKKAPRTPIKDSEVITSYTPPEAIEPTPGSEPKFAPPLWAEHYLVEVVHRAIPCRLGLPAGLGKSEVMAGPERHLLIRPDVPQGFHLAVASEDWSDLFDFRDPVGLLYETALVEHRHPSESVRQHLLAPVEALCHYLSTSSGFESTPFQRLVACEPLPDEVLYLTEFLRSLLDHSLIPTGRARATLRQLGQTPGVIDLSKCGLSKEETLILSKFFGPYRIKS